MRYLKMLWKFVAGGLAAGVALRFAGISAVVFLIMTDFLVPAWIAKYGGSKAHASGLAFSLATLISLLAGHFFHLWQEHVATIPILFIATGVLSLLGSGLGIAIFTSQPRN